MLFNNVVALCKEKKISVSRLEKETGLGNATVRGWERSTPNLRTLQLVADYFGVTVDELLKERSE